MTLPHLARASRGAALALGLLVPALTVLAVGRSPAETLFAPLGFPSLEHAEAWQLGLARALAAVPAMIGGVAFLVLAQGLRPVASGHLFSVELTRALGRFAGSLAAASVALAVLPTVVGLLLSVHAPPGQGRLVLHFGTPTAFGIVASLSVLTVAHLLEAARRIERENAGFV